MLMIEVNEAAAQLIGASDREAVRGASDRASSIVRSATRFSSRAEHTLLMLNLDRPPSELVERNP
jgi:hypothetical protein